MDPWVIATQGIGYSALDMASEGILSSEQIGAAIKNRIITRGMGPSRLRAGRTGLLTQGYGGIQSFIVEAILRRRRVTGSSSSSSNIQQSITLKAVLREVNSEAPRTKILGTIHATMAEHQVLVRALRMETRIDESVKVTAKRIVKKHV